MIQEPVPKDEYLNGESEKGLVFAALNNLLGADFFSGDGQDTLSDKKPLGVVTYPVSLTELVKKKNEQRANKLVKAENSTLTLNKEQIVVATIDAFMNRNESSAKVNDDSALLQIQLALKLIKRKFDIYNNPDDLNKAINENTKRKVLGVLYGKDKTKYYAVKNRYGRWILYNSNNTTQLTPHEDIATAIDSKSENDEFILVFDKLKKKRKGEYGVNVYHSQYGTSLGVFADVPSIPIETDVSNFLNILDVAIKYKNEKLQYEQKVTDNKPDVTLPPIKISHNFQRVDSDDDSDDDDDDDDEEEEEEEEKEEDDATIPVVVPGETKPSRNAQKKNRKKAEAVDNTVTLNTSQLGKVTTRKVAADAAADAAEARKAAAADAAADAAEDEDEEEVEGGGKHRRGGSIKSKQKSKQKKTKITKKKSNRQ